MAEFVTISAPSSDAASLAARLTQKSAEGWDVVAIVPTIDCGDRTAVIEREGKKVEGVVQETIELAPGMAEVVKVGEGLSGLFGNLTKVLGGVTDEETAKAAIPQLHEFAPVLESLQKSTVALPENGRSTIAKLVAENIGGLQKIIDTVMAIPGVKDLLGPVVTPMIAVGSGAWLSAETADIAAGLRRHGKAGACP